MAPTKYSSNTAVPLNSSNMSKQRISLFLKSFYILGVSLGIFAVFSQWAYDDPFITYRYARNIASGLGFVYNVGENTLSTTTPLFAILLAFLSKTGLSIHTLANAVTALSVAVGGLLIWELAKTWQTPWVGWTGLLLYPTFPLLLSTLGSESILYLAIVFGAFVLYARQRYGGAVLLVALAILTRSDGLLVGIVLGVHYLWMNRGQILDGAFWRKQPWFWVGISLGLLLTWHGFAWLYFGDPLPVTLAAKQAQGRMAISQHFAPGVLRIAGWYLGSWPYWVEFGLLLIGVVFSLVKEKRWWIVLAWSGLYFLVYTLLGVTSYYWYYAPLVPGWVIAVGLGFTFLSRFSFPAPNHATPGFGKFRLVFLGLLLSAILSAQVINLLEMSHRVDPRYAIYQAAGEWLSENTPQDATVGALEVGIIGYYADRSMVDFAGLVQPEVAEQFSYDKTYDDAAVWAVDRYQPDYVLILSNDLPGLVNGPLAADCGLAYQLAGADFDFHSDIMIFECR